MLNSKKRRLGNQINLGKKITTENVLEIDNLTVEFEKDGRKITALNKISLKISENQIVGLIGESGSGKSLTALSIAGLLFQTSLSVSSEKMLLGGQDLSQLSTKHWQIIRGKDLGIIFQEPQSSLNPSMRCGPQVMERLQMNKIGKPQEHRSRVLEAFEAVKLPKPERIFKAYSHELSGGQKQRAVSYTHLTLPTNREV